jgi:salicylate hydroxylase
MTTFSIGIVGAGLGGLCLAQGLRKTGIDVVIIERDATPQIRNQGYRLRVDPTGQQALARCLSAEQYQLFCATCAQNLGESRLLDPFLNQLHHRRPEHWLPSSKVKMAVPNGDLAVNRQTLREILLDGLQDHVRFGQALSAFEETSQGIELQLAEGQKMRVDLLIAADGINSVVRKQCLPQAEPVDSDTITLYGKTPITVETQAQLASAWLQKVSVVFAEGFTLVIEPMIFQASMPQLAAEYAPRCRLSPIDNYLYWAFIGTSSRLGGALADNGIELKERILALTHGWDTQLRALLALSDPLSLSARPVYIAQDIPLWPNERVSFLGDAIHTMSPAGGLGANTALADAANLADCLSNARTAQQGIAALRGYEQEMRDRAQRAMQLSRQASARLSLGTVPAA